MKYKIVKAKNNFYILKKGKLCNFVYVAYNGNTIQQAKFHRFLSQLLIVFRYYIDKQPLSYHLTDFNLEYEVIEEFDNINNLYYQYVMRHPEEYL